jgi:hypothetical protein
MIIYIGGFFMWFIFEKIKNNLISKIYMKTVKFILWHTKWHNDHQLKKIIDFLLIDNYF